MVLKVKKDVLVGFLKKSKMEGTQQIDEVILDFQKEGLKINANSPPKQSRVMSWLKTTTFKEYEALGRVGVNGLNDIITAINRFREFITIKKDGNLLNITGDNKTVDIELVAENFLSVDTGEPNLEFVDTFTMTSTKLKEIFKDTQMNKDSWIILDTLPKKVIFKNTGKFKFSNELEALSCKGGVNVKFGEIFIEALQNLDGNLEFSIKTDYPCKVLEKSENSVITIIVAPTVATE